MAKKTGILFILAAVIGISVYFYTADPPSESARPASAPAAVPARRVSKAFQIMQAAGRPPGHSTPKAEAGVSGGVEDKDRDGDREKDRKEKLAFIARLRENGIAFVSGQEEYLATLTDVDASNEASYVLVLGNRLMASAVLTEMSRSPEYSGQLVSLLHDPAMRAFITGPMAEYFPVLSRHLEREESIDAGNLSSLFPEDRDFLGEFDERVASRLDPGYAAVFDAGIADYIAGYVLLWQAVHTGEMDRDSVVEFPWGGP